MPRNNSERNWDELEASGGELDQYGGDLPWIVSVIRRVSRRFELPRTPEEEATAKFLTGLVGALDRAGYFTARDERPKAAE